MARSTPTSRSTLLTNFRSMPSALVDNLRTLIVGPDYAYRPYDISAGTNLIGSYNAVTGVTAAWPDLGTNETVDATTVVTVISQCLVRYFLEAIAIPLAANGVQSGTDPNEIKHNAGVTVWAGPSRTGNVATDVVVGDHVYLTTDSVGGNAFETTVTGFKYTGGKPNILVLADSLPAAFTGGVFFNINVDEVVSVQTLPAADYTAGATQLVVDSAITVATTRTGVAKPVYGGTAPYSQVYASYRALRQDNVLDVVTITHLDQMDTYFVGWESPESGLGFAIAHALAPQPTPALAALPAVIGAALVTNDTAGWTAVLSRMRRRTDWYTIAPLTVDAGFQALTLQMVDERVALGLVSRAIIALELTTTENLFTGSAAITLSGGNLIVSSVSAIFTGAVAGDQVTLNNGTYTISVVTSNQQATITTVATGATTCTSVNHPMTITEQSADYGARAQVYAERDTSVIFPPSPTWELEVVDGYLYAAAVAGLRGYTMPHQPLRSVQLETGWGVPQSAYEFFGELDVLGNYGCFVSEAYDTEAVVLYANTTDQSTTIDRTEGLVANADAVTRYFNDLVADFAGRTKVTLDTLTAIRAATSSGVEFLKSQTFVANFGSVIVDGTVSAPYQDPNNLDTVIVPISVTLSATLETLVINVTVSLEAI